MVASVALSTETNAFGIGVALGALRVQCRDARVLSFLFRDGGAVESLRSAVRESPLLCHLPCLDGIVRSMGCTDYGYRTRSTILLKDVVSVVPLVAQNVSTAKTIYMLTVPLTPNIH